MRLRSASSRLVILAFVVLTASACAPREDARASEKKEKTDVASSDSSTAPALLAPPMPPLVAPSLTDLGPAPDWKTTDLKGNEIGRDALKGKVVVVDIWATWCAPCVQEIPGFIELQKRYADRGLVIVGLSADHRGAEVVNPFAEKRGINYPLALATEEILTGFGGIEVLPTTFLIDREGRIRHKKIGAMETAEFEKLLLPLL